MPPTPAARIAALQTEIEALAAEQVQQTREAVCAAVMLLDAVAETTAGNQAVRNDAGRLAIILKREFAAFEQIVEQRR